jgi:hypothetical protein
VPASRMPKADASSDERSCALSGGVGGWLSMLHLLLDEPVAHSIAGVRDSACALFLYYEEEGASVTRPEFEAEPKARVSTRGWRW